MDDITSLENDIADLRKKLLLKEALLEKLKTSESTSSHDVNPINSTEPLPRWAIERYSRQILLPEIGVIGQEKICKSKVLIVGAGGLGCPAAAYLAGAGVHEIGIIDYDTVDITNIHRQILYTESMQNEIKVDCAVKSLKEINSHTIITPYYLQINSDNALDIVAKYDLILDCTDNMPTRYLLNDACVILRKPLISGSALKMEGQLTIYGYRWLESDKNMQGPCYRCLFPTPSPPETVGSCSSNGVAGPVPGVISCLQALETIKVITEFKPSDLLVGRMLLFDGSDMTFKTVKLRNCNPQCPICSASPTITKLVDYELFCKSKATEKDLTLNILKPENRISAVDLSQKIKSVKSLETVKSRHLLVDVRSEQEFKMCNIEGSINHPIDDLNKLEAFHKFMEEIKNFDEVTFLCRRGNNSQIVAQKVINNLGPLPLINDVQGGLHAWSKEVDNKFPVY